MFHDEPSCLYRVSSAFYTLLIDFGRIGRLYDIILNDNVNGKIRKEISGMERNLQKGIGVCQSLEGQGPPPLSRAWKKTFQILITIARCWIVCSDLLIQSNVDADPSAHLDLLSDEYDAKCVRSIFVYSQLSKQRIN